MHGPTFAACVTATTEVEEESFDEEDSFDERSPDKFKPDLQWISSSPKGGSVWPRVRSRPVQAMQRRLLMNPLQMHCPSCHVVLTAVCPNNVTG